MNHLTPAAKDAIENAEIVIGYKTYLEFVQDLIEDAEVLSSGMRREVDRCDKAVDLALEGNKVAVICSGDPGIYAMAGLVLEIAKGKAQSAEGQDKLPPIEVIPGVSALNASAARLGAPIMHDFASISMSDLLTPWELIEKRLEAAASADFVIAIYNPKSKGRQEHIGKAREIILKFRSPDTPVGIVRAATRDDEKIVITDLNRMLENEIDMQSTVIIGNSQTFTWEGRMITPRGYQEKYKLE